MPRGGRHNSSAGGYGQIFICGKPEFAAIVASACTMEWADDFRFRIAIYHSIPMHERQISFAFRNIISKSPSLAPTAISPTPAVRIKAHTGTWRVGPAPDLSATALVPQYLFDSVLHLLLPAREVSYIHVSDYTLRSMMTTVGNA